MRIRKDLAGCVVLVVALLGARPADAAVIVYSDLASFNSATTSQSTITFEGLAPVNSFTYYPSPPGLTTGGVTFTSSADVLFVIDPGYAPPPTFSPDFAWSSGQFLMDNLFEPHT